MLSAQSRAFLKVEILFTKKSLKYFFCNNGFKVKILREKKRLYILFLKRNLRSKITKNGAV